MSDDLPGLAELFLKAQKLIWPTPLDRYREFRQVFLGSDAGQRVLDDMLRMCRFHERTAVKDDAFETYFREGQRSIALSLLKTVYTEPRANRPQRQISTEE